MVAVPLQPLYSSPAIAGDSCPQLRSSITIFIIGLMTRQIGKFPADGKHFSHFLKSTQLTLYGTTFHVIPVPGD